MMKIEQGNIYWYSMPNSVPHPCVVIQDTIINQSRVETIVICGITSNLKKASWPGYVLLEKNEGNLSQKSIIDVSQISAIHKEELGEYIGKLSEERIDQIFTGIELLQNSFRRE